MKTAILLEFRKTSLISYNSEIVLQKIRPANSQIPPSQPVKPLLTANPLRSICNGKPQRFEPVIGQARTLLNTIQQDEWMVYWKCRSHIEKVIHGSLTCAFTHYLLHRDLNAIYKEEAALAAQKEIIKQAEQKRAVITLLEIRERTTKWAEDEVEKTRNALRQAEIAAEKKAKAEINAQKRTNKTWFKEVKVNLKARPRLRTSPCWGGWVFCRWKIKS